MANTIATDILNPNTAGNRNTTTNAGVRLNVENAMEIGLRLNKLPTEPRDLQKGFQQFMYSDPNAEEALHENAQWRPVRALGKGGMGWVTLWKKYDANNMEIDTCAIKEQPFISVKYGPDHRLVRLAFRGNEINNLPRGDHEFDQDLNRAYKNFLYEDLVDNKYKDIRWGRLKPPYQKWKREIELDLRWAKREGTWPTGEGPFRWDGSKVVLGSEYEPGREVFPRLRDLLNYPDSSNDSDARLPPVAPIPPNLTPAPILPPILPPAPKFPPILPPAPVLPIVPAGYPMGARRACNHRCLNKRTCRHGNCCKLGV